MVLLVVGFEEGEFAADRVVGFCGNCSFSAQSDLEGRERERERDGIQVPFPRSASLVLFVMRRRRIL
jgi:hypothetical protein